MSEPLPGLYSIVDGSFIDNLLDDFSIIAATDANQYTGIPPVTGNADDVSYTFSSFGLNVFLGKPSWAVPMADSLELTWSHFNYLVSWKYEVKHDSFPHVSEHGDVFVFTVDPLGPPLSITLGFDLTRGPNVSVVSATTSLRTNESEVFVQCHDTFCLIPVSDIAKAVAAEFPSLFVAALNDSVFSSVSGVLRSVPLTPALSGPLALDLRGAALPPFAPATLSLASRGAFFVDSHPRPPPFSPTTTGPKRLLSRAPGDLALAATPFSPRSLIWAAGAAGLLDVVVTDADTREWPLHLTTGDPALLEVAPGLAEFPSCNVTLRTALRAPGNVVFEPQTPPVVAVDGLTMALHADITNATFRLLDAFVVDATMPLALALQAGVNATTRHAQLTGKPSVDSAKTNVTQQSSKVGKVDTDVLEDAIMLIAALYTLPNLALQLPPPANFSWNSVKMIVDEGVLAVAIDVEPHLTPAVPPNVCTEQKGMLCPAPLPCCPDGTGVSSCCVWGEGAACCGQGGGCCPAGCQCANGECQC